MAPPVVDRTPLLPFPSALYCPHIHKPTVPEPIRLDTQITNSTTRRQPQPRKTHRVSRKYQRVRQADLLLPAPLRWLTRAFSSITMAVILLTLVMIYGAIGSVPVGFLVLGGVYALIALGILGPVGLLLAKFGARIGVLACLCILTASLAATALTCRTAAINLVDQPWIRTHLDTVIYRLPSLEMTELEFFSWWPLKLILGLFVVNLIWATIRRIEFRFVNIGVLSVHTGIVLLAIGSMFYGTFKVEGDVVLFRDDLGGRPVAAFYDRTAPAVFFYAAGREIMIPVPELPRYNDHTPGQLDIRLHESDAFRSVLGDQLQATIPGFVAYGTLESRWEPAVPTTPQAASPALRLGLGERERPVDGAYTALVARQPAQRYIQWPGFAVEFLYRPDDQRVTDLVTPIPSLPGESRPARHGLIVEIPDQDFRAVYAIAPGMHLTLDGTGYHLTIEDIGNYGMPFATPGYEDARDTRVTVHVHRDIHHARPNDGHAEDEGFRRIAMHRFPERSQDFVPAPNDPNVGPMGRRRDPDPSIRLTYLDSSRAQFHLIADTPEARSLQLIARLPGEQPLATHFDDDRFPLAITESGEVWGHIVERLSNVRQVRVGVPTPDSQRKSSDEGTFLHALLPVDLSMPQADGTTWSTRLWLAHMRYPDIPELGNEPAVVTLPDGMPLAVAFSRVKRSLPFAMQLEAFEMQPYPGTEIPRDYVSRLGLYMLDAHGRPTGESLRGDTRLNHPLIADAFTLDRAVDLAEGRFLGGLIQYMRLGRLKLSQTGWDPGDARDPMRHAVDAHGRFLNQQRFSIIGVGNNASIRVVFIGSVLVVAGIPWAFWVKPALLQRAKRRLQTEFATVHAAPQADAA